MLKLLLKYLFSMPIGSASRSVGALLSLRAAAKQQGKRLLVKWITRRIQKHGVFIAQGACIHPTVCFPHPIGIVIGDGVKIGGNVRVFQNVTLGGARIGDADASNYPVIGAGTTIFAGAVIVGKVSIGSNCTIGANSVVLHDIPDNSVAVGVPARVVRIVQPLSQKPDSYET